MEELKGFETVTLQRGEERTVSLPIAPDRLAFWNIEMEWVVEPGESLLMTGPSSAELQSTVLTVR